MSDPHSVSAGEIGGIVAIGMTVLGAIGGGIAWLFNYRERRATSRTAKLAAWQEELNQREVALDRRIDEWTAKLELRVKEQEGQIRALRLAFELVAAPLRASDPGNPALRQAEHLLSAAFPIDVTFPRAMAAALSAMDDDNGKERT